MSTSAQETEVKFYLHSLNSLEARLKTAGAQLVQPRAHELNLRFDQPDHSLSRSYRVLRLRQDAQAYVTYKGPGTVVQGAKVRQELEFSVSNFDMAKALFEALGYQVVVIYEKYRATYRLDDTLITLDEMPYGDFAEIEGADGNTIQRIAGLLDLDWEERILDSYLMLFERLRAHLGFTFRDLTFANFEGVEVTPQALGITTK